MVNLTAVLLADPRQTEARCTVLDLKASCRGYTYVRETIKLLSDQPDEGLMAQIVRQVMSIGRIYAADAPVNAA